MSNYDTEPIPYDTIQKKLEAIRSRVKKPLTYAEKILYGHLVNVEKQDLSDNAYLQLNPGLWI